MMRLMPTVLVALAVSLGAVLWSLGSGRGTLRDHVDDAPVSPALVGGKAIPGGALLDVDFPRNEAPESCSTGCSTTSHPIRPLTDGDFRRLVAGLAGGSDVERRTAMETLLFHGTQVRDLVARLGLEALGEERGRTLRRELSRTHARLWLRLVDEEGVLRASVDGARMPVGQKEHIHATTTRDLQPPEVSGTIHRTGVDHLWIRL